MLGIMLLWTIPSFLDALPLPTEDPLTECKVTLCDDDSQTIHALTIYLFFSGGGSVFVTNEATLTVIDSYFNASVAAGGGSSRT